MGGGDRVGRGRERGEEGSGGMEERERQAESRDETKGGENREGKSR